MIIISPPYGHINRLFRPYAVKFDMFLLIQTLSTFLNFSQQADQRQREDMRSNGKS